MSTASEKQLEDDLRSVRLNRALKKGELQGAAVGTLAGTGLGALGSLGYAALRRKPLSHATPVLGGLAGFMAGDLAGVGLGLKKYFEGERGRLKKAAAVTPDEVIPPGEHVPSPKPASPAGKIVPRGDFGYSKLPESFGDKIRRGLGDLGAGWEAAGNAWKKKTAPGSHVIRRAVNALRDDRAVLGFDLLRNKLPGAQNVPFMGRVGGAARLLGPQAAVAAGTLIPAALLIKAFKEDKSK